MFSFAASCRPAASTTPLAMRRVSPQSRSRIPSSPRPKLIPCKQRKSLLLLPIAAAASSSSSSSPSPPSKASLLVAQGRAKYAAGDRMGALALFESALKQSPSAPEAAAASWNATVVHCSFGDVELAQITLRDALAAGLDFERALTAEGRRVTGARVDEIQAAVADNDAAVAAAAEGGGGAGSGDDAGGDPSAALRLPFAGSPQVASQLRKFARAFARASSSSSAASSSAVASYSSSSSSSPSSSPISVDGIDASPAAIAKRVAVLLAVLVGLGVGLFLYGLPFLDPTS